MSSARYCSEQFALQQIDAIYLYLEPVVSNPQALRTPTQVAGAVRDATPAETSILEGQPKLGAVAPASKGPQQRIETFLDAHHPKFMYHATKPPVQVFSRSEIEELGPDWSETYAYQEYPKCKYHRTGKTLTVKDADEEAALGEGWGDSSVGPFGLTDADPLRWFDEWELESLPPEARDRIREGLANVHADVIDSVADHDSSARRTSMRKAFELFTLEYLNAALLTEWVMSQSIPRMVYDAAVSAGWQTGALQKNRRCTIQFGHYWVPSEVPAMLEELFRAHAWRLRGKLPRNPSEAPEVLGPAQSIRPEPSPVRADRKKLTEENHPTPPNQPAVPDQVQSQGREKTALRRNRKYEAIDSALCEISEARPKSHEEVFRFLTDRHVPIANREPFKSAGGWLKGFQQNPHLASVWLSQAWGRLELPTFARGPKK
jgi:hypothetical protein